MRLYLASHASRKIVDRKKVAASVKRKNCRKTKNENRSRNISVCVVLSNGVSLLLTEKLDFFLEDVLPRPNYLDDVDLMHNFRIF